MPALSQAGRARQKREHRGSRDGSRAGRLHLGHQPAVHVVGRIGRGARRV